MKNELSNLRFGFPFRFVIQLKFVNCKYLFSKGLANDANPFYCNQRTGKRNSMENPG